MENIEAKNLAICWRPLGPPGREPERARLAQPCSRDVLQYHHRFWQQQLSLRWLKISTWLPISKKFSFMLKGRALANACLTRLRCRPKAHTATGLPP